MKKKLSLFLFFALCTSFIFAQNKELTIEEAVIGQWREYYPEYLYHLMWKTDTDNYLYVKDWVNIVEGNLKNDKIETILSVEEFNKALKKNEITETEYFYGINWLSENRFEIQLENKIIVYDLEKKDCELVITIDESAENVFYSDDSKIVAYTVENNLFFATQNSKITQISSEQEGIVCGSDYVHRQEFGIDRGIFFSKDGNSIAFYRKDETMVADYPIVDFTAKIATEVPEKYPMAGEKSEEVTLGVYDIKTGKTVFMKTGEPKEQYLTSITWDPTGKFIYIGLLNREQNHLKMNKYDAVSGDLVKTLFEEKNDRYVEPEHSLIFLENTPNQFLYYSERDNYQHLYLYDTEGNLINQVTSGEWIVTDFLGFDEDEKNIFIMATKDSPIENNAYKVNLKSGKITRLTQESGMHTVQISSDGKYFIDEYSSTEVPRETYIGDAEGKKIKTLLVAENPYTEFNLGKMEINTIKSADGETDLYYRLITPPDFDKTKKYPAIVYVYGGPHAQLVTNEWLGGAALWEFYMAQKGYVVYVLDNRGSANRGLEFENVIHRHCGVNEMEDQMKGIDFLKNLGYVDMDRIGVHGWSYGGFMTTSLITNYPDIFKVGVAGGPVIDWKYYEVMYGERYMDTPQENPEGYEETSLLNKAADLEGKLLLIHGCIDPVVVWQNSIMFVQKCIENEVLLDYFVYPTSEHNVRGYDRVHLMRKVTQYFDENL